MDCWQEFLHVGGMQSIDTDVRLPELLSSISDQNNKQQIKDNQVYA